MEYWDVVSLAYNASFSIFFLVLAGFMFFISHKGYKAHNRYGAISTAICGVGFIIFAIYNSIAGFFPFPYHGFMMWWTGFIIILNVIFAIIVKREKSKISHEGVVEEKKEKEPKKKSRLWRYTERMITIDPYHQDISIRMEVIRKSFHLTGLLVLVAYYGLFIIPPIAGLVNNGVILLINQPVYNFLWGDISLYPYTLNDPQSVIDITMFGLIGPLVFAIISDLIRILWGPEYSFFNFLTKSMLREKELNAAGPQIYIITGFIFSYMLYMMGLLDIRVFFTGILIACLSDAAAAIIGRTFGKHKVKLRNGETKSIEGFVAGVVVAYIIGIIFVGPFYAIFGAVIFFITDYLPAVTADNILNPIAIPIGIQLSIVLIGLPITGLV